MKRYTMLSVWALSVAISTFLVGCGEELKVDPTRPYSLSIQKGETLYLSGQGGRDPETGEHPQGVKAATHQTMLNLQRELESKGWSFADAVATHVWLTDMSTIGEMTAAYRPFFEDEALPTRTTVAVAALPGGSPVEIAMVAARGEKQYIYPEGTVPGRAPFSPGILVGDTLYLSGQAGVVPGSSPVTLVEGDVQAHVRQTLENIGTVLGAAGMDFSQVVSTEVFLTDMQNFGPLNEVYRSFTQQPRPARVPIGASALPLDSPVEITMIADRRELQAVLPEGMPPSDHYSRGLRVGNRMYLAGVYSRKPTSQEQLDDSLDRVKQILGAGGFTLSDIVEARVYLLSLDDYGPMNAAYISHFANPRPTRATVAVPLLPGESRIGLAFVAEKNAP